jgi:two-component system NtrC family sensor kinase
MSLFFLGILGILAIDGYFLVQRDIRLFDSDMRRDALHLGHTFKDLVADAWRKEGQPSALEFIGRIDADNREVRIRWVWLDAVATGAFVPRPTKQQLDSLSRGEDISFVGKNSQGTDHRYTYVPLQTPGGRHGALELSEPLTELHTYTHHTVLRTLVLGGLIAIIGLMLLWFVGIRMVGRPLNQLVAKTARIGAGDFAEDLVINGRDELSDLAVAMNRMCQQLAQARAAVQAETEARLAALEQLRHSERLSMLGRISSGLAHEMGTPLNVVAGRAKMIESSGLDPDEIITSTRVIREQVDRMTRIIRQLLDFARRRAGQHEPESIEKLVRNVLDMLKPTAQKAGVVCEVIKSDGLPPVAVDRFQIEQVLMNLVMNGIQAMPQGGRLRVNLRLERSRPQKDLKDDDRDCLVVKIADEGIGISAQDRDLVFEPFFTTKKAGQGTGLGLSIVKGIVEEHDGWLTVESESGQGTTFAIFLPLEAKA